MLEDHKRTGAYYNAVMRNRRQFQVRSASMGFAIDLAAVWQKISLTWCAMLCCALFSKPMSATRICLLMPYAHALSFLQHASAQLLTAAPGGVFYVTNGIQWTFPHMFHLCRTKWSWMWAQAVGSWPS